MRKPARRLATWILGTPSGIVLLSAACLYVTSPGVAGAVDRSTRAEVNAIDGTSPSALEMNRAQSPIRLINARNGLKPVPRSTATPTSAAFGGKQPAASYETLIDSPLMNIQFRKLSQAGPVYEFVCVSGNGPELNFWAEVDLDGNDRVNDDKGQLIRFSEGWKVNDHVFYLQHVSREGHRALTEAEQALYRGFISEQAGALVMTIQIATRAFPGRDFPPISFNAHSSDADAGVFRSLIAPANFRTFRSLAQVRTFKPKVITHGPGASSMSGSIAEIVAGVAAGLRGTSTSAGASSSSSEVRKQGSTPPPVAEVPTLHNECLQAGSPTYVTRNTFQLLVTPFRNVCSQPVEAQVCYTHDGFLAAANRWLCDFSLYSAGTTRTREFHTAGVTQYTFQWWATYESDRTAHLFPDPTHPEQSDPRGRDLVPAVLNGRIRR